MYSRTQALKKSTEKEDKLCPICGANLQVWFEMFREVHVCKPEWNKGRVV